MATCTLQDVFQDVRGFLNDTGYLGSIPTGESFTNAVLPPYFGEPYRTLFSRLVGSSKRVQRVVYLTLPAPTTVLIPSTYGIQDFSEPEMIEERLAPTATLIASTDTSTPIQVTTSSPHGFGPNGSVGEGAVSGVLSTAAPWGRWFFTVTGASTFTLNGSASDGVAGSGGAFYPEPSTSFTEVAPLDLTVAGLDGPPQQVLGNYLWINEQLQFRGSSQAIQLRITYYASGTAPTNPNYTINIDNARDFLSKATAANAAASRGWTSRASELKLEAYGDPQTGQIGLLDTFIAAQVLASQRGPIRRQQPFREKRFKYGVYLLG